MIVTPPKNCIRFLAWVSIAMLSLSISCTKQKEITPEEARTIAKEAYTYANPVVDSYRILHSYFVNAASEDYKAGWNEIKNIPRVYTHEDKAVQTPNSDTPYSFLALDLRSEPMVLTVPQIEEDRYFSIQLIDLYTHNFEYLGSRTIGNKGGQFLVTGPGWNGKVPEGITKQIESETELMLAIYRTQLYNPEDLDNVKEIQEGYKAQSLSTFLSEESPATAPEIKFIAPLTQEEIRESPKVFEQLNFVLQFCPTHPSEKELMERFAKLNIGAGKNFDWDSFSTEIQEAIALGIKDAWEDFAALKAKADAGEIGSGEVFGTRDFLQNNYLYRMAAAVTGIWGNSEAEAIYPSYYVDANGDALSGTNNYRLRFEPGIFPPANSFWSLTLYQLPESLLVDNPLDRYLLNSTMVDDFVRDEDGGITLYVQNESPDKEKEPNWLPAPEGPFSVIMRLYWPKEEALDGGWELPPLKKVD